MPDPSYVVVALAVAVAITVSLRALPFGMRSVLRGSALLADVERWMPLGAVTILAVYCLAAVDTAHAPYGVPQAAGVLATAGLHAWRRNIVLSILGGTVTCLVLTNLVLA